MIDGFRHAGLKRLFEDDDRSGVPAEHVERLRTALAALQAAERPSDLDMHTFQLRALKGRSKGFLAVTVRARVRVTFRFGLGNAYAVDLVDRL
jgi:proteic killer suppression protein